MFVNVPDNVMQKILQTQKRVRRHTDKARSTYRPNFHTQFSNASTSSGFESDATSATIISPSVSRQTSIEVHPVFLNRQFSHWEADETYPVGSGYTPESFDIPGFEGDQINNENGQDVPIVEVKYPDGSINNLIDISDIGGVPQKPRTKKRMRRVTVAGTKSSPQGRRMSNVTSATPQFFLPYENESGDPTEEIYQTIEDAQIYDRSNSIDDGSEQATHIDELRDQFTHIDMNPDPEQGSAMFSISPQASPDPVTRRIYHRGLSVSSVDSDTSNTSIRSVESNEPLYDRRRSSMFTRRPSFIRKPSFTIMNKYKRGSRASECCVSPSVLASIIVFIIVLAIIGGYIAYDQLVLQFEENIYDDAPMIDTQRTL